MFQVLLVTGGYNRVSLLDSTEILETPDRSWRTLTTARLPSPRYEMTAGSVNNVVFMFGGDYLNILLKWDLPYNLSGGETFNYEETDTTKKIFAFNKAEEIWEPAGEMIEGRTNHAVEVIDNVSHLCP